MTFFDEPIRPRLHREPRPALILPVLGTLILVGAVWAGLAMLGPIPAESEAGEWHGNVAAGR